MMREERGRVKVVASGRIQARREEGRDGVGLGKSSAELMQTVVRLSCEPWIVYCSVWWFRFS